METAGPYREELEPQINAEVAGQGEAASPPKASRDGSLGEKEVPNVTGANPKRTVNSRPS